MQDFISSHSYKSLILDLLFNRSLARINSFLFACWGRLKVVSAYRRTYWTKMYPIALICWSPLSPPTIASLTHVLKSLGFPPVPNPILESQLLQSFWLLLMIVWKGWYRYQLRWIPLCYSWVVKRPETQWASSTCHGPARYLPSAISEYRDLAWWLMITDLNCWPIFIPRQILLNGVFQ